MSAKIVSALTSCETPEQINACRHWVRDLYLRRKLDEPAARVLQQLADDLDLRMLIPRRHRAGAPAAAAVG